MKYLAGLILAAAFSVSMGAKAEDINTSQKPNGNDIMVGAGLICDTKQQAERFVSLMGEDVENALVTVNNEAGQNDACVVATVGFFPGQKVAEVEKDGSVVNVIEVLVMAVSTPAGLKVVEPKMYYSVVRTKDRIT